MVEVVTLWSLMVLIIFSPFFMIRKSCNNSYELFYVSRKWPELLSSVTSCDLFCFFL
jgi:hypothetical protein